MFLAVAEIRRSIGRFVLLSVSIGLLVFLILFQQTLQDGLITAFVGAIERQSAPVLVYSVDGRRNLQGSVITPEVERQVRAVDGVGEVGLIGQGTFSVTAGGDLTSVAMIGYSDEQLGAPVALSAGRLPAATGEVVALDGYAADGFAVGDTIRVEPDGPDLTVVGTAPEIGYQASTTVFTTFETFEEVVRSSNPDATTVLPSALALAPDRGVSAAELADRVNDEVPDAEALTRADAAAQTPGVAQVRQSFQLIFLLYGLVVPLVTGLFFLIITVQKAGPLTLLRAVGVQRGVLVRSLLVQVAIVLVAGIGLGTALYAPVANRNLGGIALTFQAEAVVTWGLVLLVLGLCSALVSARRVLRIDPLEATTGGGVGR